MPIATIRTNLRLTSGRGVNEIKGSLLRQGLPFYFAGVSICVNNHNQQYADDHDGWVVGEAVLRGYFFSIGD